MGVLALKDAELLSKQQDLSILVDVSSTAQSDEVEQQRERLGEKKEKHTG